MLWKGMGANGGRGAALAELDCQPDRLTSRKGRQVQRLVRYPQLVKWYYQFSDAVERSEVRQPASPTIPAAFWNPVFAAGTPQ